MNKLDKSWEDFAQKYLDRTYSLSYERTTWQKLHEKSYLQGASDFQKTLLKRIQYKSNIASKGNTDQAFVAKICFEGVVEIIKNLKTNE